VIPHGAVEMSLSSVLRPGKFNAPSERRCPRGPTLGSVHEHHRRIPIHHGWTRGNGWDGRRPQTAISTVSPSDSIMGLDTIQSRYLSGRVSLAADGVAIGAAAASAVVGRAPPASSNASP